MASTTSPAELLSKVVPYVKEYMSHYDGSHDFAHIERVLGLAHLLRAQDPSRYDATVVSLCALLHDVGDKKYLKPGQDATTAIRDVLLSLGADAELAEKVQGICSAVSYSSETSEGGKDKVEEVIAKWPELEVVQDADRLDAIGAVGVARCWAFGGAKGRDLENGVRHFEEKLVRLEGMTKTRRGREMARERTERIREVRRWWQEEVEESRRGLEGLDFLG